MFCISTGPSPASPPSRQAMFCISTGPSPGARLTRRPLGAAPARRGRRRIGCPGRSARRPWRPRPCRRRSAPAAAPPAGRPRAGRAACGPGVVARGRHVGDHRRRPRVAQSHAHQPPSVAGPRTASAASPRRGATASASRSGSTCGVSIPSCSTRVARAGARGVPVRGGDAVPEVGTALRRGRDPAQRAVQRGGARRPGQVAGQGDDHAPAGHGGHRGERVEQGGGGQIGRLGGSQGRAQPGLHPPGLGRLGDHQQPERRERRTVTAAARPCRGSRAGCRAPSPRPSSGRRRGAGTAPRPR